MKRIASAVAVATLAISLIVVSLVPALANGEPAISLSVPELGSNHFACTGALNFAMSKVTVERAGR